MQQQPVILILLQNPAYPLGQWVEFHQELDSYCQVFVTNEPHYATACNFDVRAIISRLPRECEEYALLAKVLYPNCPALTLDDHVPPGFKRVQTLSDTLAAIGIQPRVPEVLCGP